MSKKLSLSLSLVIVAVIILNGCSNSGKGTSADAKKQANPEVSNEPITLKFYTMQNDNYSKDKEANFDDEIGRFIKAKFPNITIEHLHKPKYEDFMAAGEIPDIILESSSYAGSRIKDNGMAADLAEYIKKYNVSLARINPVLIEQLKTYSGEGKLFGLPFTGSNFITFYNKDLFDKYGVPYLKDGMTWDDYYEVTKKLAHTEGETNYIGLVAHSGLMMKYNQLSLDALDVKEDKAAVQTDGWKSLFENLKRFYELPNNPYSKVDDWAKAVQAIDIHVSEKLTLWPQQNPSINWDVVSAPTLKEKPKVGLQPNMYSLYLSSGSKNKDAAFQVINLLISDEVQTHLSKKGYVVPLVNKDIQKVVGQDIAGLKGKNVENAIYYNSYANPPQARAANVTYYDGAGSAGTAFDNMVKNKDDVNTTLRKWDEDINQKIAALKAQKGTK